MQGKLADVLCAGGMNAELGERGHNLIILWPVFHFYRNYTFLYNNSSCFCPFLKLCQLNLANSSGSGAS